jgi:spermidine/putrescine transport system permease protein
VGGYLRRHRRIVPFLLLAPGILWLVLFYVVPGFQMFLTSFWSGTLETGYEFSLSNISNYTESLTRYWPQFSRSLLYGALATLLTFAISYPLAYTIAFRGGRYKNLLLFLVVAPFFTSFLLRTISWKIILGDTGIVLGPLKEAGLLPEEFRLLATPIAVVAGITYNFLPFMTLPIYVSLEKIDRRLVEAAEDLFATSIGAFRRITLPLSLPGVFAGSLLTFIPAMGDYVNAFFLGGPNNKMIGNTIQSLYITQRNYPDAAALSFVLLLGIMAIVLIYIKFAGSEALMGDEERPA